MILREIEHYMKQRQQSRLLDLSRHFGIEQDAMRGMLNQWIRKGKLRTATVPNCQKACDQCVSREQEIYQWIDNVQVI